MRSEGCNRFKNEIEKLYISMLSHGSEGSGSWIEIFPMLNINTLSYGSEGRFLVKYLLIGLNDKFNI